LSSGNAVFVMRAWIVSRLETPGRLSKNTRKCNAVKVSMTVDSLER
jgi:hypothetical protein